MDKFEKHLKEQMKNHADQHVALHSEESRKITQRAIYSQEKPRKLPIGYWLATTAAIAVLFVLLAGIVVNYTNSATLTADQPLTSKGITMEEIQKIDAAIIGQRTVQGSETEFTIQVTNASKKDLLDMELLISYDIRSNNSVAENPFQAKAAEHTTVPAGQQATFTITLPTYVFNSEYAKPNGVTLKLQGFLGKIANDHFFSMGKSNSVVGSE